MINIYSYSAQTEIAEQNKAVSEATGRLLLLLLLCTSAFFITISPSFAASQLMLTPHRVVFSGADRSAKVTVINSGDETGTYRISLVNKRMTADGKFEDVKTPQEGELFSDKMIRYSPRQVVLGPGKSQVVRLSLRKPANLAAGEYRTHMLFNAIPKDSGVDIEKTTQSNSITIKLTPIVSISIPVIVRHGKTEANVSFTSAKLEPVNEKTKDPLLHVEMQREGNQSIYGDLLAEFIPQKGRSKIISQVNGVAVYVPNKMRSVKLPVRIPDDLVLKNGSIRITYRSPAKAGGRTLAQTEFPVQ